MIHLLTTDITKADRPKPADDFDVVAEFGAISKLLTARQLVDYAVAFRARFDDVALNKVSRRLLEVHYQGMVRVELFKLAAFETRDKFTAIFEAKSLDDTLAELDRLTNLRRTNVDFLDLYTVVFYRENLPF